MPAPSKAMRKASAIAEKNPGALYARNRGLLNMTRQQLHDFAATKEKGLPARKRKKKPRVRGRSGRGLLQ